MFCLHAIENHMKYGVLLGQSHSIGRAFIIAHNNRAARILYSHRKNRATYIL